MQPGRLIGMIFGLALGYYAGLTLLIPLGFVAAIGFVLFKALPSRKPYLPPAAIISGHIAWMGLGGIILGQWAPIAGDMIVLGAGVVWLLARPGFASLGFLVVVELGQLGYGVFMLAQESFLTDQHKARLVHSTLYAVAALLLGQRILELRKESKAQRLSPSSPAAAMDLASSEAVTPPSLPEA